MKLLATDDYILDVTTELEHKQKEYFLLLKRTVWIHPIRLDNSLYIDVMFFQVFIHNLFLSINHDLPARTRLSRRSTRHYANDWYAECNNDGMIYSLILMNNESLQLCFRTTLLDSPRCCIWPTKTVDRTLWMGMLISILFDERSNSIIDIRWIVYYRVLCKICVTYRSINGPNEWIERSLRNFHRHWHRFKREQSSSVWTWLLFG